MLAVENIIRQFIQQVLNGLVQFSRRVFVRFTDIAEGFLERLQLGLHQYNRHEYLIALESSASPYFRPPCKEHAGHYKECAHKLCKETAELGTLQNALGRVNCHGRGREFESRLEDRCFKLLR